MESRTCKKCGIEKSLNDFDFYTVKDDSRRRAVCKSCKEKEFSEKHPIDNEKVCRMCNISKSLDSYWKSKDRI